MERVKRRIMKNKYALVGFCLGLLAAGLVFLIERTTQEVGWLLIASFPISWGVAGCLFGRRYGESGES